MSAFREDESQRQATMYARLKEEIQRLEDQVNVQARRSQKDQDTHNELQAALKQMTSAHAQLALRLNEEERSRNELQKGNMELQAKMTELQKERSALSQQLQLEREVHQKELDNTKATMEEARMKKDREVQDMLQLCHKEREEIQARMREVKVGTFFIKMSVQ